MRRRAGILLALALATGAQAQQQAVLADGAVLRGLDKVTGEVEEIVLRNGEEVAFRRLRIRLGQCRYPQNDPAGDAFAFVTITEAEKDAPAFSGWMIASSPALNALDHPRYDVWVMRCSTE